jgi:TRAP-type C4-dicarboxylate transport system permease small subunit
MEAFMQDLVSRIIGRMERILTGIAAAIMGLLSLIVCWQVFARYVLQKSPIWVEEFSVTAIMWIGLLGAAAAVWTGDHMRLELLTKRLPKQLGVVVEVLIDVAIGYFSLFLLQNGWVLTQATWTSRMSTIPLPLGITYLVLPIAAVFMIFFALFRIMAKILEATRKKTMEGRTGHAR